MKSHSKKKGLSRLLLTIIVVVMTVCPSYIYASRTVVAQCRFVFIEYSENGANRGVMAVVPNDISSLKVDFSDVNGFMISLFRECKYVPGAYTAYYRANEICYGDKFVRSEWGTQYLDMALSWMRSDGHKQMIRLKDGIQVNVTSSVFAGVFLEDEFSKEWTELCKTSNGVSDFSFIKEIAIPVAVRGCIDSDRYLELVENG